MNGICYTKVFVKDTAPVYWFINVFSDKLITVTGNTSVNNFFIYGYLN